MMRLRVGFIAVLFSAGMPTHSASADASFIRIGIDRPPETLNPRRALDAMGQRLGSLLFRALTRLNEDLSLESDLADRWTPQNGAKEWRFRLKSDLGSDHSQLSITPEKLLACFENYRKSRGSAPVVAGFPSWKSTELQKNEIVFKFDSPDPYFAKNATLLRYFTPAGAEPCSEPATGQAIVTSGRYRPQKWVNTFQNRLAISPIDPESGSPLEFVVVKDDGTRVLTLIKGELDVVQNGVSLAKTRYLQNRYAEKFKLIERDGVSVSYLAFNNRDPLLKRKKVRQAIAHAIDRETIVRFKMFGFGSIANSLLSPMLPEALNAKAGNGLKFDLEKAKLLLDEEGLAIDPKTKTRFQLRYRTTPLREGIETAMLFREMLSKAGILLKIEVVEPAVFLTSIRNGNFQLYSSRWIGVSDASILDRSFGHAQGSNRFLYENEQVDRLLLKMLSEENELKRAQVAREIQAFVLDDLPVVPLWFWNNALIASHGIEIKEGFKLSLSGAYEPLSRLKRKTAQSLNP